MDAFYYPSCQSWSLVPSTWLEQWSDYAEIVYYQVKIFGLRSVVEWVVLVTVEAVKKWTKLKHDEAEVEIDQ